MLLRQVVRKLDETVYAVSLRMWRNFVINKVTPHDGNPFHQNAHHTLNCQVIPIKICILNRIKSLL